MSVTYEFPLGDIAATTINSLSKNTADNLTANNALLRVLSEKGNIKTFSGGEFIEHRMLYGANANTNSYAGADPLAVAAQPAVDAAVFPWKQYSTQIIVTEKEKAANSGKEKVVDLIEAKVKAGNISLRNRISVDLYGDGTGNDGKNITGLKAAVVASPSSGIYGGINRATAGNAFWRNKAFVHTTDFGGAAATKDTILTGLNGVIQSITVGAKRPDLILVGKSVYNMTLAATMPLQRFSSGKEADAGYQSLFVQGIKMVWDESNSNFLTTDAYVLNTDHIFLQPHEDYQFSAMDDVSPANQHITVKSIAWYGELTSDGLKYQAKYSIL